VAIPVASIRMILDRREAFDYLKGVMPGNKALGLLAQLDFERWARNQEETIRNKYFPGCWVVSLKDGDFYALKTCFFVGSKIERNEDIPSIVKTLHANRQFHALNSALKASGFETMHCIPIVSGDKATIPTIKWRVFRYYNERLEEQDNAKYFNYWQGRGRPSNPREWLPETAGKFKGTSDDDLTSLVLPQLFFNGFFKAIYRASVIDPYDTDGFIVSYDGKVFPIELKEKFPFYGKSPPKDDPNGKPHYNTSEEELADMKIGVDVGRVLMLLRICLPLNTNGYYVVREVEKSAERKLKGWKYVRLDEIVMKSYWNTQAGGPGMASSAKGAGSDTSTIIIPYSAFYPLDKDTFADITLREHATLTDGTRRMAEAFASRLKQRFGLV
jgi:hypothetical protein